jgi:endogenous inhibitor of DNA gyrase (YacG/DUF329 family)
MTARPEICENCGKPSVGKVNGAPFCAAQACIDAVLAAALKPARMVKDAVRAMAK